MNPRLRHFITALLAHHRRLLGEVMPEDVLTPGFVAERCSCGNFHIQRPQLRGLLAAGKHHSRTAEITRRRQLAMLIETQWTDHLIETVAEAVADWLDAVPGEPHRDAAREIRGARKPPQDGS